MKYKTLALCGCALSLVTLSAAAGANFRPSDDNGGVTLTGSVAAINDRNEFLLDYGSGVLPVETDQVPSGIYSEGMAESLKVGEIVTVSGWIDNGTFRGPGIDAHTLVRDEGSQIYSAVADVPDYYVSYYQPEAGYLVMSGNVRSVSGDEFTLDYGNGAIRVDAGEMDTSMPPFMDTLRSGDEVVVTGWMDDDLFQSREIRASDIVRVSQTASIN